MLERYYHRRYSLFSRFDLGVELDEESWYSVTPEQVAQHHARRCGGPGRTVVDACCGVGGNAIQLALSGARVIAVDVSATKLDMGRTNAAIYGVADRIEWVCADFLQLAASGALADRDVYGVFCSPPWGGPAYVRRPSMTLEQLGLDGRALWRAARQVAERVGMFLPRNLSLSSLQELSDEVMEVEANYLNHRCLAVTVYWGGYVASP